MADNNDPKRAQPAHAPADLTRAPAAASRSHDDEGYFGLAHAPVVLVAQQRARNREGPAAAAPAPPNEELHCSSPKVDEFADLPPTDPLPAPVPPRYASLDPAMPAPAARAPTRAIARSTTGPRASGGAWASLAVVAVAVVLGAVASMKRPPTVGPPSWEVPAQNALRATTAPAEVVAFVARVGQKLVTDNHLGARAFLLSLDDDPALYVLPCSVVVSVGLLSRLTTESQLAGVLALGLAHVERADPAAAYAATPGADALLHAAPDAALALAKRIGAHPSTREAANDVDARTVKLLAASGYQLTGLLDAWGRLSRTQVGLANPGPPDRRRQLMGHIGRAAPGTRVGAEAYATSVVEQLARRATAH